MLELKKMIENIEGADGNLYSDHIINLFEDVSGNLTGDKAEMLSVFEAFEKLSPKQQQRYQVARRLGIVGALDHMELLNDEQNTKIDLYLEQLDDEEKFEDFLLRLLRRYI